jgi:xanthine dehydrogenase accessory factor
MDDIAASAFFSREAEPFVIILGVNEIASAIAVALCRAGCRVVLSHDPYPPVIRRRMAFHDALFDDVAEVDGVVGRRAASAVEIIAALATRGRVAVTALPFTDIIPLRAPQIVVDARLQKYRVTPDLRGIAPLAVGVGPQFHVRENCDVAVETHPQRTGELVGAGKTRLADGVARPLGGVGKERFVYAPREGVWRTPFDVGAQVFKGVVLGYLDGVPVRAPRDGRLRGVARDGALIPADVKLIEIDPRGRGASWTGVDERGRVIASAVVEAIRRTPPRRPCARVGLDMQGDAPAW